MLTAERLRELLSYDQETGVFTWRVQTNNRVKVGMVAGSLNGQGYVQLRVDGIRYAAHRLAWLYVHGEWPKHQIDHINGSKADNRIANLRDGTQSLNQQNRRTALSTNKTGFLGVASFKGKFRALIYVKGKHVELGSFETPERAHAVYIEAKRKYHEGCTL